VLGCWVSHWRSGTAKRRATRTALPRLATQRAEALCWSPSQIRAVRWGAYLHDVGKMASPDGVLLKPGPSNAEEWAVMRSHVAEGVILAAGLDFLTDTMLVVVPHHLERWNGQGYPAGKTGREISLAGRVFALCAVYDALTSERPYKAAWTPEAALAELTAQAGKHFDAMLTGVFVELLHDGRGARPWPALS
jgi:putative nucleotidyltransferase with HDIG domain